MIMKHHHLSMEEVLNLDKGKFYDFMTNHELDLDKDSKYFLMIMDKLSDFLVEKKDLNFVALFLELGRGANFGYPSHSISSLLKYSMEKVISHPSSSMEDLRILNCCLKSNVGVRIYLKELDKADVLYQTLISLLHSLDSNLKLYALSVLARLILSDGLGQKIFDLETIDDTFNFILRKLTSRETCLSIRFDCIDLIEDINMNPSFMTCFEKNQLLQSVLDFTTLSNEEDQGSGGGCSENQNNTCLEGGNTKWTGKSKHKKDDQLAFTFFLHVVIRSSHKLRRFVIKKMKERNSLVDYFEQVLDSNAQLSKKTCLMLCTLFTEEESLLSELMNDSNLKRIQNLNLSVTSFSSSSSSPLVSQCLSVLQELHRTSFNESFCSTYLFTRYVALAQLVALLCKNPNLQLIFMQVAEITQLLEIVHKEAEYLHQLGIGSRNLPKISIFVLSILINLANSHHGGAAITRQIGVLLQTHSVSLLIGASISQDSQRNTIQYLLDFIVKELRQEMDDKESKLLSLSTNYSFNNEVLEHTQQQLQEERIKSKDDLIRYQEEIESLRNQVDLKLSKKDSKLLEMKRNYEDQISSLKAHCDNLSQMVIKKKSCVDNKEKALQENKSLQSALEEELLEYKGKVLMLENRLMEATDTCSKLKTKLKSRDQELVKLNDENQHLLLETAKQENHLVAKNERIHESEKLYERLCLLAKIHQEKLQENEQLKEQNHQNGQEKQILEQQMKELRHRMQEDQMNLRNIKERIQRRDHEIIALTKEGHERNMKMDEMNEIANRNTTKLNYMEERIQIQEQKIESLRHQVQKKQEEINQKTILIEKKNQEIGKTYKLTALIHKLSGGDTNGLDAANLSNLMSDEM